MNQSQSRTIRYAVAGLGVLALLVVIALIALRQPPPSSPDQPPVRAVTVSPRAPLFTPNNDALHETPTNTVAGSAPIPTNAATIYQQAFAIYDALSPEQKSLIGNWRTNVDASVAAELCEKIQPICDRMHQAAAATNCDWGLEQPVTFETRLPYLASCRNLARAAVWSADHCRTNDPSSAVDDLIATSRLGQNVSSPATLIAHLVDLAIQGLVVYSVAENASLLARAGDTRLAELLNDANYDEGLRRAIEQEADMITTMADRLATMPSEEVMRELTKEVMPPVSSQIQSMGPVQAIAEIRQAAELQREYAKALELPEAEYRSWLTSVDETRKTNPFVGEFVSNLGLAVDITQAMTVRSAMAVAGLAVTQDGTDALPSHPDPNTGQPFTYTQTPDGFELESSFQLRGKSLKLPFK